MNIVLFFFFSSRRRHTRCSRDWSSDVCSSDLTARPPDPNRRYPAAVPRGRRPNVHGTPGPGSSEMLRSEERRVGKSVDLGGRRIIKKKKKKDTGSRHRMIQ